MTTSCNNNENLSNQQELDEQELISFYEQSHIVIGKRVGKSDENSDGFKHVDGIPANEVSFLFLGGTGTEVEQGGDKSANGYLSYLERYIRNRGIEDVLKEQGKDTEIKKSIGLYSVVYDFGKTVSGKIVCNSTNARGKLFTEHKQVWARNPMKIVKNEVYYQGELTGQLNEDTLNPHYVEELFNRAFLSRICDENGKKLSVEEACKRVRNITICAHCHGAYTFLKIEEKMQQKMKELGYSNEERAQIQSQMLCIAFSPDIPLGVSKSTLISFISSYDGNLLGAYSYNYNNFKDIIYKYNAAKQEIEPAYFSGKKGEFLLIQKIYEASDLNDWGSEHNLLSDKSKKIMTEDGKMFFGFASNVIVNGMKSSLEKTPLPSIKELLCSKDEKNEELFERLKQNGDDMWEKIKIILARNNQRIR